PRDVDVDGRQVVLAGLADRDQTVRLPHWAFGGTCCTGFLGPRAVEGPRGFRVPDGAGLALPFYGSDQGGEGGASVPRSPAPVSPSPHAHASPCGPDGGAGPWPGSRTPSSSTNADGGSGKDRGTASRSGGRRRYAPRTTSRR